MKLIEKAYLKLFRRKLITEKRRERHALLYYITDSFTLPHLAKRYEHIIFWEALAMKKILNDKGYAVDVIDRTADLKTIDKLEDKYNLFIGLGAGQSGKYFAKIAERIPQAYKVLFALGQEPEYSNKQIHKRYRYFKQRHGVELKLRRLKNVEFKEFLEHTDAIFIMGNTKTFEKYNKPIHKIYPSTHPEIEYAGNNKNPKKFLYFGGNGNIVKGLDLVIEAFEGLDLELNICSPLDDDFKEFYKDKIKGNIKYHGFVKPIGSKFKKLTRECAFMIFPSSTEGCATSVTTCMRAGLIPVITEDTCVNIKGFGFIMGENVADVRVKVIELSNMGGEEVKERSLKSYNESFKYTQKNMIKSFSDAIDGLDIPEIVLPYDMPHRMGDVHT